VPLEAGHAVSFWAWLGLPTEDRRPALRLGSVIGLFSVGDFLIEGAVTSVFLARVGAEHLPAALAGRAVSEALFSVAFARFAPALGPRRALATLAAGSAVALGIAAALLGSAAGVIAAFVVASTVARLKVIHFGVLALAELPGAAAARALPAVYACARVGAIAAGPLLAIVASHEVRVAVALGALVYGAGFVVLRSERSEAPPSELSARSLPFAEEPVPSEGGGTLAANARALMISILVGAVALAVGRLALTTQSGAILEAHYDEAALARVFGVYFALANLLGLVLQLGLVGRVLRAGGLPWLNTGWSALYVSAQVLLALGPAVVPVALGARLVESELRNTARTPVANLLYEGLPPERRAGARTWVIGVAIPLASLAAGAALALSSRTSALLSVVGVTAAIVLLAATLAQNRAWRRTGQRAF
jgi:hypothetical protein